LVCLTRVEERPDLRDPVLVEGLPGVGFVANIAVLHLIEALEARIFAEIRSSSFQSLAVSTEGGQAGFPINRLYYHRGRDGERDLILLYGNIQAQTRAGQYELCGRVLDLAQELGCRDILTLGGLPREGEVATPKVYCAASDAETLQKALSLGAEVLEGRIYGAAGLLVGLGGLRGMRGLCLLAETPGYPDAKAAREALRVVSEMLHLRVDLGRLDRAAEETRRILGSFGIVTQPPGEEAEEEPGAPWRV